MLELKDLFHLPQIEPLFEQIVRGEPGLVVISGLDPRPLVPAASLGGFLPSGRAAIFRILLRQMLAAHPGSEVTVVSQTPDVVRLPRGVRHRVQYTVVRPGEEAAGHIAASATHHPGLLVIDRLDAASATAALEAANSGLRVLAQLDTVFRGAQVARHLFDLGVPGELLAGLAWVVAVHRLATLCPYCKEPAPPGRDELADLIRRFPGREDDIRHGTFFRAPGCARCQGSGREGEVTAFDVFRGAMATGGQQSVLDLEEYLLGLALYGQLSLDDLVHLESEEVRRTYYMLAASEQALAQANANLEAKLAELQAANRVLEQRTRALVSLEGINQALIMSPSLAELGARLCYHARDLCGADRAILYYLRAEAGPAEVLAVHGWDPAVVHQRLDASLILSGEPSSEPTPFSGQPPGVPRNPVDLLADTLRAGLRVPLVVRETETTAAASAPAGQALYLSGTGQATTPSVPAALAQAGKQVGLMIVHTSHKARFAPGEVALLQSFANQAALAIQRASLVEALQDSIEQLKAAQAELVQKERMEKEMELARQVQQSVLPTTFPYVPGYAFAGRSRSARWVGGDFYDVILLDDERFGLVMGDVSDKGMAAALYMALTHSLLRAEARRQGYGHPPPPRTVLANVDRLLRELGQSEMFVTVFYGIVDGPRRKLTYARAGHDRPLLLRGGKVLPLVGAGTVLGFPGMQDLGLSEEELDLAPGDRLVLYTDGLCDVMAPDGQPFGRERLRSLLETYAKRNAFELCSATLAALASYQNTAEQFDDMTLLVVEVT
jgi:serine phosphatase RsbU (regulator of sigma subunit)